MRTPGKTNIATVRWRSVGRIVLALLLTPAFGAGCTTVSCEWSGTLVAGAAPGTTATPRDAPCDPGRAEPRKVAAVSIAPDGREEP